MFAEPSNFYSWAPSYKTSALMSGKISERKHYLDIFANLLFQERQDTNVYWTSIICQDWLTHCVLWEYVRTQSSQNPVSLTEVYNLPMITQLVRTGSQIKACTISTVSWSLIQQQTRSICILKEKVYRKQKERKGGEGERIALVI